MGGIEKMIFNKRNIVKYLKEPKNLVLFLSAITSLIILELKNIYADHQILVSLFFAIALIAILAQLVEQKIGLLDFLLFLSVPIFLAIEYLHIDFNREHINFIVFLQLFTIFCIYHMYGEKMFTHIWDKNIFGLRNHWNTLPVNKVEQLYMELLFVLILLVLLHTVLFTLSIIFVLLYMHYFFLLLLLGPLCLDYAKTFIKREVIYRKQVARYFFHVFLIILIFDTLLEELSFISTSTIGASFWIYLIFVASIVKPLFRPEPAPVWRLFKIWQ